MIVATYKVYRSKDRVLSVINMLSGLVFFSGYWQMFRDLHNKLYCIIGAVAVTLLTLHTFVLTFLLNQLSIVCCVGTQKNKTFVVS